MAHQQEGTEDAISLVKYTAESFDIESDLTSLDRIQDVLRSLKDKRQDKIVEMDQILKELGKNYQDLQEKVTTSEKSESRLQIKQDLLKIDSDKFEMAKKLTDLEFNLNQLQTNHSNLIQTYQNLMNEKNQIIEDDLIENYDSIVLKLKLFKKMGIIIDIPEADQQLTDDPSLKAKKHDKVIIYNKSKDTTNVLNVDHSQYSSYFITNYIWERI